MHRMCDFTVGCWTAPPISRWVAKPVPSSSKSLGATTAPTTAGSASRFKSRLIGNLDPDEWDLRPKPKWMRWATYDRQAEQFDRYEAILDYGRAALAAKFLGK
jgi:hypothetical protein